MVKRLATAGANPSVTPDAEDEPRPDEADPASTTTVAPAKDDGLSTNVMKRVAVSAVGIIIASTRHNFTTIAIKYGKVRLGQALRHLIQFWRTGPIGPMLTGVIYYGEAGMVCRICNRRRCFSST